jgi:hypothetical protein
LKLTIEKLGRIQKAEMDVRPLTVLIGPNNTNKTWTAYALYGLLQSLSRTVTSVRYRDEFPVNEGAGALDERLKELLRPLFDSLTADPAPTRVECSLAVPSLFEQIGGYSQKVTCRAETIGLLLGAPPERVPEATACLELMRTEFVTSLVSLEVVFELSLNRLLVKANRRLTLGEGKVQESSSLVSHSDASWTEQKMFDVVYAQLGRLIEHVVVFPAERNGILPVWSLIPSQGRLDVPVPVTDFGTFLGVAQAAAIVEPMSASQSNLAGLLKKVMGGEIAYITDGGRKRLVFRVGDAEVPLNAAASLSRAVAGLSIYLERFFRADDVLIIDELEMNAHPQAQVALTEFIAALVNAGVRVVFTTHSPYVVDHLNNLMEASRVPAERQGELAGKFALGSPSCFISPEKVAVHAFLEASPGGEVVVREALNRQTGLIDWSTFSGVSERITNLYSDILRTSEGEA